MCTNRPFLAGTVIEKAAEPFVSMQGFQNTVFPDGAMTKGSYCWKPMAVIFLLSDSCPEKPDFVEMDKTPFP